MSRRRGPFSLLILASLLLTSSLLVYDPSGSASAGQEGMEVGRGPWRPLGPLTPSPTGTPQPPVVPSLELATIVPEIPKGHPKLESVLNQLLVEYRLKGDAAARAYADKSGLTMQGNQVLVVLKAKLGTLPQLLPQVEALGARPDAFYGDLLQLFAPLDILERLAALPEVNFVARPQQFQPLGASGSIVSEAVEFVGAGEWQRAGFQGQGVKSAVIDLGFQGYGDLLGTELPLSVITRCFTSSCRSSGIEDVEGSTEHGTANAEILHDMAPHAQLYLVRIGSVVDMGLAVDWLLAQGVRVVSFSLGVLVGPYDGTDDTDRIVDRAKDQGVLWATSAGNHALRHYDGTFTDTDGDGWHEFAPGVELNPLEVTKENPPVVLLALSWDDWPESAQDYDLYLFLEGINQSVQMVGFSQTVQDGTQPPAEVLLQFVGPGRYLIGVRKAKATRDVNLEIYSSIQDLGMQVPASSLSIPAAAKGGLAVGATNDGLDIIEDFSSRGPTNDGRVKPDLVAPDRVRTVTYGTVGFEGTSASAPHVAGAAALVLSGYPWLTSDQVQGFLEGRAQDIGAPGKDNTYGAGRLRMGAVPLVTPVATPTPLPTPLPCLVESKHPYADDFDQTYTITNSDSTARFSRVHFQRLDVERSFDFVIVRDGQGNRVQVLTGSYPTGLWSDPVPGAVVKLQLQTDFSEARYGFCVDRIETTSGVTPTPTATSTRTPTPYPTRTPTPTATPTPVPWPTIRVYLPFVIK